MSLFSKIGKEFNRVTDRVGDQISRSSKDVAPFAKPVLTVVGAVLAGPTGAAIGSEIGGVSGKALAGKSQKSGEQIEVTQKLEITLNGKPASAEETIAALGANGSDPVGGVAPDPGTPIPSGGGNPSPPPINPGGSLNPPGAPGNAGNAFNAFFKLCALALTRLLESAGITFPPDGTSLRAYVANQSTSVAGGAGQLASYVPRSSDDSRPSGALASSANAYAALGAPPPGTYWVDPDFSSRNPATKETAALAINAGRYTYNGFPLSANGGLPRAAILKR